MFGSFTFGLGTDALESVFGAGGGRTGILSPLIVGRAGTLSKSYGLFDGAGAYFSVFFLSLDLSFLTFLLFLSLL